MIEFIWGRECIAQGVEDAFVQQCLVTTAGVVSYEHLRVLHPAAVRNGVSVVDGLWLLVVALCHNEWVWGCCLLVAQIVDVSFASHHFYRRHLQRILSTDNHRCINQSLVAAKHHLVKVEVHLYTNLVAFFLDYLIDYLDILAFLNLICASVVC